MWIDIPVIKEDLDNLITRYNIEWERFRNTTILITGATGLIGVALVNAFLYAESKQKLGIRVLALVRDREKADRIFEKQLQFSSVLQLIEGSVEQLPEIQENIHYIIHGASPTKGSYFIERPVETIQANVAGTMNLLELARVKEMQSFLYLSSMEVYGGFQCDELIEETFGTSIDTMQLRSSYPESKRICETLCASYYGEYQVPTKVIRLAQTFGAGISKAENRVFAQLAKAAINQENIVLHTKGASRHGYLYITDAIAAILITLLLGVNGEAYNAVNQNTYCSIYEMACLVATEIANDKIKVIVEDNAEKSKQYPKESNLNMSKQKLEQLGWRAFVGLREMYQRMICAMQVD